MCRFPSEGLLNLGCAGWVEAFGSRLLPCLVFWLNTYDEAEEGVLSCSRATRTEKENISCTSHTDNHFYLTQKWQDVRDLLPATLGKACMQLSCHLEQWPAGRDTAVAQAPDRTLHPKSGRFAGGNTKRCWSPCSTAYLINTKPTMSCMHTSALTLFGALSGR
jgi:hypothetical protein